jgi:hypothetical protein
MTNEEKIKEYNEEDAQWEAMQESEELASEDDED